MASALFRALSIPSFRALSGRLEFTVSRHEFNEDFLPAMTARCGVSVWGLGFEFGLWALGFCVSGVPLPLQALGYSRGPPWPQLSWRPLAALPVRV